MAELDTILKRAEAAKSGSAQAQEELNAFIEEVTAGKQTTGDIVRDFALIYGHPKKTETTRLREVEQRITEAKGQPILVQTRFTYRRDRDNHHNDREHHFGCAPPLPSPLDAEMSIHLMRFGVIDEPKWTRGGLDVASSYAFQIPDEPFWGAATDVLPFEEWAPHAGPLRIGAAEMFNNFFDLPLSWYTLRENVDKLRDDLSSDIVKTLQSRPLRLGYSSKLKTNILIGDEIEAAIKRFGHFRRHLERDVNISDEEFTTRILADARSCITNGMGLKAYEAKQAAELHEKQQEIFTKIVHVLLQNQKESGYIASVLVNVYDLGVHKTDIELTPVPGMRVKASEYLPPLYEKYDVRR